MNEDVFTMKDMKDGDFPANHVSLLEGNLFDDMLYLLCQVPYFSPLKLVILSSIPCGFESKRCNELVFYVHISYMYYYIYYIYMYWHRI